MELAYEKGKLDASIDINDLNEEAMGIVGMNKDMLDEFLRIDGNIRMALETNNDMALYDLKTPKFFPQEF